jgi:hypothetical protein
MFLYKTLLHKYTAHIILKQRSTKGYYMKEAKWRDLRFITNLHNDEYGSKFRERILPNSIYRMTRYMIDNLVFDATSVA